MFASKWQNVHKCVNDFFQVRMSLFRFQETAIAEPNTKNPEPLHRQKPLAWK